MQFFDVFESRNVSIDAVDKTLASIRLCSSRGDLDGDVTPGKYFRLCPLGFLRGIVHVVEVSNGLKKLNGKLKRTTELESRNGKGRLNAREWGTEFFYANRFHILQREYHLFKDAQLLERSKLVERIHSTN